MTARVPGESTEIAVTPAKVFALEFGDIGRRKFFFVEADRATSLDKPCACGRRESTGRDDGKAVSIEPGKCEEGRTCDVRLDPDPQRFPRRGLRE